MNGDEAQHQASVERYEKNLRELAEDWGLAVGPDGLRGPWTGAAAELTRFIAKLWDQWAELELERAEVWAAPGRPRLATAKQAVVLRLLGGAATSATAEGELPGVATFIELQRLHFESGRDHPTWKPGESLTGEQLRARVLSRFKQEQLFLWSDYVRQLESTPADSVAARRARRLQEVLLVTPK